MLSAFNVEAAPYKNEGALNKHTQGVQSNPNQSSCPHFNFAVGAATGAQVGFLSERTDKVPIAANATAATATGEKGRRLLKIN